ncbi:acyl carrier protein [Teratosphaeria nubilosa]|uniref:Acyl carrier protein n=1 Tax=Teratosphaeria nubilosa TaxID=161662 RepID=A0A6G1LKB1_9PEZI|nr:acyl carrier protein [Teratosphaeria nubilosa]
MSDRATGIKFSCAVESGNDVTAELQFDADVLVNVLRVSKGIARSYCTVPSVRTEATNQSTSDLELREEYHSDIINICILPAPITTPVIFPTANMYRTAFLRAARSAAQASTSVQRPAFQRAIQTPFVHARISTPATSISAVRCYASSSGLGKEEVTGRILDLLKNFDKDPSKLSAQSHFTNDLGLDSLDTVEVVMAIEEEFSIEIPDKEADAIHSVNQAVDYIMAQPDAH